MEQLTPKAPQNILLIYSHSDYQKSHYNQSLIEEVQDLDRVVIHNINQMYPSGKIDVQYEQKAIEKADMLLFQHPMFWYSYPPLLKTWIDQVLTKGWAYGKDTFALQGKHWLHSITTGTKAQDFTLENQGFPFEVITSPLERLALFFKAHYHKPLRLHDVYHRTDEELTTFAQKYRDFLVLFTENGTFSEKLLSDLQNSLV